MSYRMIASLKRGTLAVGLLGLAACEPAAVSEPESNMADEPAPVPAEDVNGSAGDQSAGTSIMRPEVAAAPDPEPVQPETLVLPFGFNGNDLDEDARAALDKLLQTPAYMSGGAITVRGHTDSKGFDVDNRRVSQKRADAVRDYLIEQGVAAERITAIGIGEARPVAPNARLDGSDDPEGRERNRRVEVEIAAGETPVAAE